MFWAPGCTGSCGPMFEYDQPQLPDTWVVSCESLLQTLLLVASRPSAAHCTPPAWPSTDRLSAMVLKASWLAPAAVEASSRPPNSEEVPPLRTMNELVMAKTPLVTL